MKHGFQAGQVKFKQDEYNLKRQEWLLVKGLKMNLA